MPAGHYPVVYTHSVAYGRIRSDRSFRPYVTARLTNPLTGLSTDRLMLVDSGADSCAITMSAAQVLGVDLTRCERGSSGGTGGPVDTYYTDLEIMACGQSQMCPVAIPERNELFLLGRDPFFHLIHFGFAETEDPSQSRFYWHPA